MKSTSSVRKDSLVPISSQADLPDSHPSTNLPDLISPFSPLGNEEHNLSSPNPVHVPNYHARTNRVQSTSPFPTHNPFPGMINPFSKSKPSDEAPTSTSASPVGEEIELGSTSQSAHRVDLTTRVWSGKRADSDTDHVLAEAASREDSINVKTRVERREEDV
jgi:hypothetical protein